MTPFEAIATAVITGFGFGLGVKFVGGVDWLIGAAVVGIMRWRQRRKAP